MKKIAEIREEFEAADFDSYEELFHKYTEDDRSGVKNLIAKYSRKKQAYEDELARTESLKTY